jgi:hypothetical protein
MRHSHTRALLVYRTMLNSQVEGNRYQSADNTDITQTSSSVIDSLRIGSHACANVMQSLPRSRLIFRGPSRRVNGIRVDASITVLKSNEWRIMDIIARAVTQRMRESPFDAPRRDANCARNTTSSRTLSCFRPPPIADFIRGEGDAICVRRLRHR